MEEAQARLSADADATALSGRDYVRGSARRKYWLSHLGIEEPLPDVVQATNMGSVAPGGHAKSKPHGGSKSGRRRKRPLKGGKKFVNTPWGSDKT